MYEIEYWNRSHGRAVRVHYATLEKAKAAAAELFDRLGIVAGIHRV